MNLSLGLRGWNSNPSITTTALPGRDRARRYFRIASSPAPGAFRTPARDNIRHKRVGPIPTASVQRYESYSYDDVGLSSIVDDPSLGRPVPKRRAEAVGPGARASPSCAWPRSSTPRRPRQSRPTLPAGPQRTAPRSGTSNSNANLTAGAADADDVGPAPSPETTSGSRGTRCSRFAFMRMAEIVHTAPAASISSHVPAGPQRPRRGQHQKLERQLDRWGSRRRHPHRLDGRGHVLVGQRQPVRHDVVLRTEHRKHAVARVVNV